MQRIVALILSIFLIIPIIILIILATIDTQSFGLFTQERIGKSGKPFSIFKIRTLKGNYSSSITSTEMKKSWFGKLLRNTHLDELPQIFNILVGHMNFAGPRPDTQEFYDLLSEEEFQQLTSIKPGIFGIAQFKFSDEEKLLSQQPNPEQYYKEVIWKEKVQLNIEYLKNKTFQSDIKIIYLTLLKLLKIQ